MNSNIAGLFVARYDRQVDDGARRKCMTLVKLITVVAGLILLSGLSACNRGGTLDTCDEPEPYQLVVEGKHIEVPEGLDSLDEFKEVPIPRADSPPRPEGSKCIDYPPSIQSGS